MLLVLAGALALLGVGIDPGHANRLTVVAALDLLIGAVTLLLPWHRGHPVWPALLGLPAFAVLGLSTWSFGGVAAGTGPFLVLIFAWAALHFPRWVLAAYAIPAMIAYVVPLVLTRQPPMIVGSAFVLLPVALAVAFLIESQGRRLRDDRERLVRIERWRAALIGTVAHDVRSPLAAVQFVLEDLRDDATRTSVPMLDAALRQTARITRLANGLLDLNRIDSTGRLNLDRRPVGARDLVTTALSYVRAADVEVDVPEDLQVCVDRERFEQIIINLVGNALRYGQRPITVRLSRDGAVDRLEVRDHGPGIPDELRTSLFSRFAASDGGASSEGRPRSGGAANAGAAKESASGEGSVGLGLWIVRRLAEAHGGEAHAEAREPGVAMVVTFPALAAAGAKG
nr:HAMP domain-containing sensor histidine kinase [uncultured Actinoplanes sp.]